MNNTEILTGFKAKNQQTELEEETKEAGIENVKTEEPVAKEEAEKKSFIKNTADIICCIFYLLIDNLSPLSSF